jgi:16S rRNA (cytidine1402-2'-O)-methyltransferase
MSDRRKMHGKLYLVATPIGNLDDMTARAVDTLRSVDVIACEDTRHSRKLLSRYSISNKLISYHEHNEAERAAELVQRIKSGESVAVITDAGTPGISDPGYRIVAEAIGSGIDIVPVPGPAAFVAAATVSGLATDSIFFGGFLPRRSSERRARLAEVGAVPATLVFYEAPHRLSRTLADCLTTLGDRRAVIVRELTKIHEETVRGTLAELAARSDSEQVKGEIVIVIERGTSGAAAVRSASISETVEKLIKGGLDHKAALKHAAKEFGLSRSEAYRRLVEEKPRS